MRRPESLLLCLLLAACASGGRTTPSASVAHAPSSGGRLNLGLAEGYLTKGDLPKAAERAEMVIASDPRWAQAHALRAVLHERAGETDKARRAFDRALALAPKDGAILNAHAVWLCGHGQVDRADREFSLALADPDYRMPVQALANAGKCASGAGRLAAASDYLRRALVFAPTDRILLFMLADLELRQGKTFEAQAFIQRRDALGADGATLDLAARIEDAAGNEQGADRYRARLRSEFPDYAPTGEGARSP
jgi:type IV pilus assembly protein PilF